MSTLERAIAIAVEAHAGQVDKAGFPYILHPIRVMSAMRCYPGQIVGVLHDVAEDNPAWPVERLAAEGFDDAVVTALSFLRRPKHVLYDTYIDELARCGSPLARAVKLQDLGDNLRLDRMGHLALADRERLTRRYRAAFCRLGTSIDLGGLSA